MDWDAIGAVGEVVGAAGVIVTLAFLTRLALCLLACAFAGLPGFARLSDFLPPFIELTGSLGGLSSGGAFLVQGDDELGDLDAVRNRRVHVLLEDHVVIPGPRIIDTIRTFAVHLHPEVEWE